MLSFALKRSMPIGIAVRAPVWVWHGELDHIVGPAHARWLSAVLPNSRLVLYPEGGTCCRCGTGTRSSPRSSPRSWPRPASGCTPVRSTPPGHGRRRVGPSAVTCWLGGRHRRPSVQSPSGSGWMSWWSHPCPESAGTAPAPLRFRYGNGPAASVGTQGSRDHDLQLRCRSRPVTISRSRLVPAGYGGPAAGTAALSAKGILIPRSVAGRVDNEEVHRSLQGTAGATSANL
jgi:hypothetical protein